jgi:hypothetical protein
VMFAVMFGILLWVGLWLRDSHIRRLLG